MRTIKVIGLIDERHRLVAQVPEGIPPGPVEVSLSIPAARGEVEDAEAWTCGIGVEWADELADPRQDVYTLEDGEPADGAR